MSRAAKGALAFGAAVVLWRTADLFLFTDVPTGFCAGGAVWRYAAMGAVRAGGLAVSAGRSTGRVPRPVRCPAHMHRGVRPSAPHARLLACGRPVSLALYGPQLSGHHVTPQREMLAGAGALLCAGYGFLPWGQCACLRPGACMRSAKGVRWHWGRCGCQRGAVPACSAALY